MISKSIIIKLLTQAEAKVIIKMGNNNFIFQQYFTVRFFFALNMLEIRVD